MPVFFDKNRKVRSFTHQYPFPLRRKYGSGYCMSFAGNSKFTLLLTNPFAFTVRTALPPMCSSLCRRYKCYLPLLTGFNLLICHHYITLKCICQGVKKFFSAKLSAKPEHFVNAELSVLYHLFVKCYLLAVGAFKAVKNVCNACYLHIMAYAVL